MCTSPRMSCSCFTVFFSTTAMSSSLLRFAMALSSIEVTTCCGTPHYRPRQNDKSLSLHDCFPSPVEPLPSCLCHLEQIYCKAIGVDWPELAVDRDAPSASIIVLQGNGCFPAIAEALSRQLLAKGILVKGEPLSGDVLKNGL
jgi:hypothetical protein